LCLYRSILVHFVEFGVNKRYNIDEIAIQRKLKGELKLLKSMNGELTFSEYKATFQINQYNIVSCKIES